MNAVYMRKESSHGVTLKLHRGEGMCLLGFDLDDERASEDFVGFAIRFRAPGDRTWKRVWNRLRFSYDGLSEAERRRGAPSTEAPIQKYRWLHFPHQVTAGEYRYKLSPVYMRPDGTLSEGRGVETAIPLAHETVEGFLDVGFTRGYASSQAYADKNRFPCQERIVPAPGSPAPADLDHDMSRCTNEYEWLGFEGRRNIYALLDEAIADQSISVDALIYEMREPAILAKLEALGGRLRALLDNHGGNNAPTSNESVAAERLTAAGAQVKRAKFGRQQHNKVFVLRRDGRPFKVLAGSTNFSLRGLYVQSNNCLIFADDRTSELFAGVFEAYFSFAETRGAAGKFRRSQWAQEWFTTRDEPGGLYRFAFSPHRDPALSLDPVAEAIENAEESVLYAMVFLNQLTGRVRETLDELVRRSLFSYGVSQRRGALAVYKPDGSRGLVSFAYLGAEAPEPFASEWSSHAGGNSRSNVLHHKFVVTDFNGERPTVFTGSSNMAKGGEKENADHLIRIEDGRVATAYAVEALRSFDHFHFRVAMQAADRRNVLIALKKPPASGEHPWFREVYIPGHVKARDRLLFTR